MAYRQTWGEHRVFFYDEQGRWMALPASWTDAVEMDPFVVVAAGRSYFRVEDLRLLTKLVAGWKR